ncbi:hypothetical protein VHEMI04294 [[Torrubiella] hemipterigena]|uniref:Uncharacterized protein n=1 Tax=[Torrubiella] hemipterigena TaxID=1531966 RepID=A0A0A1TDV0_9HYPO|nr:hypothetical protein VHEMI04294 [[Torrubiella] hemipterigena]
MLQSVVLAILAVGFAAAIPTVSPDAVDYYKLGKRGEDAVDYYKFGKRGEDAVDYYKFGKRDDDAVDV